MNKSKIDKVLCGILSVMIIFSMAIGTSVFADGGTTVTISSFELNPDTQQVTVRGRISPAAAKQRMTLRIINAADLPGGLNNPSLFVGTTQKDTDLSGAFTLSVKMRSSALTGFYKVLISGTGVNTAAEREFKYYNPTEIAQTFVSVNTSSDANSLRNIIMTGFNAEMLGLDFTYYTGLTDAANQTKVFNDLFNMKQAISGGFKNATHLNDGFKQACFVQKINEADASTVKGWIETDTARQLLLKAIPTVTQSTYQTYLNVYSVYSDNFKINTEGKNAVFVDLVKKDYGNSALMWKAFNERVIVHAISRVNVYGDVRSIIENADIRGILNANDQTPVRLDYTTYDSLKNKENVWKAMKDNITADSDYAALGNVFNAAVNRQEDDEDNSGNSSGGGGGGKSPGGSTVVTVGIPIPVVTPAPVPTGMGNFNDLNSVPWAVDSINALVLKNIINGYDDKTFRPNDVITREQFIKLLVAAFYHVDASAATDFSDVPAEEWYAKYVATAQKLGLSAGIGDNLFGVGKNITRQEMVAMAYRAVTAGGFQIQGANGTASFKDSVDISEYAVKPVQVLQNAGVINGGDDNHFNPNNTTTRAEAAKVIYKLLQLTQKID